MLKKALIIFFVVCILAVFNATRFAYADADWTKNPANGHSYRLTEPMIWMEAEAQAQEWGGHLVTLNSWEEELWIKKTFGENELFWIGFNDINEEGNWMWSSGEPVTYINWAEVEPNDCGGPGPGCEPEDAAAMNWCWEKAHFKDPCLGDYWNDLPIGGHLRGVVEKNVFEPGRPEPTINMFINKIEIHLEDGKFEIKGYLDTSDEDFENLVLDPQFRMLLELQTGGTKENPELGIVGEDQIQLITDDDWEELKFESEEDEE